jgi:hypothetical protein
VVDGFILMDLVVPPRVPPLSIVARVPSIL